MQSDCAPPVSEAVRREPVGRFRRYAIVLVVLAAVAGVAGAGRVAADDSPYELITVGDAGNAASLFGHGDVGYEFPMGKNEVTIRQYAAFLSAVASSDPYSLYETVRPWSGRGRIPRECRL